MAKPRILVCYSEFDKAFGSKLVDDLTLAGAQTSILAGDALQQIQGYERNAQQILTDGQCEWFIQVWTWKAVNSAPVLDTFRTACDLYMVGRIEGLIVMAADDVGLREIPNVRSHGGISRYFDASANYALALNRTIETVGLSPLNQAKPIFITYRRDDSAGHAGRLRANLSQRYGEEKVFMDLAIEPGVDFVDAIKRAVGSCAVLLAVIGRYWLTMTDANTGMRRLDNSNDFVHMEISTALQRNIRVIPVLVHRAQMPTEHALPDDLKALARRQAYEITDSRWDYDVAKLMTVIDKLVGSTEQTTGLSIAESAEDDEPPLNVLVEVAIAKGEWHNSEGQHEAALASFSDAINYLHHRVMPYQNLLTSEELDDYEDQFRRAWQGNAEAYQGLGEDRMAQIAAKTARDGWQDELNRWKRK